MIESHCDLLEAQDLTHIPRPNGYDEARVIRLVACIVGADVDFIGRHVNPRLRA